MKQNSMETSEYVSDPYVVEIVELRARQGLLYQAAREPSVVEAWSLEGHNSVSKYSTLEVCRRWEFPWVLGAHGNPM